MTCADLDLASVLSRLDRLERQNRLWKCIALALVLGLAIPVLMGAAGGDVKPIVATGFTLVDSEGKNRGELSVDEEGSSRLLLGNGKSNRSQLMLKVLKSGQALIVLYDPTAKNPRMELTLNNEKSSPNISLYARSEKKILMQLGINSYAYITAQDLDGNVLFNGDGDGMTAKAFTRAK
jgi:hypothetical protein